MKYFIGDTHFGHVNILEFEKEYRPFKNIDDHDWSIVGRWNSVIDDDAVVYHLGDVFFGNPQRVNGILHALKGHKYLILGNHDKPQHLAFLQEHFEKIYGVARLDNGIVLSHIPVHSQQLEFRFKWNIHGHSHSKNIDDPRYINVSCEQINLTPISLEELRKTKIK